jgi:hypothetical protein
MTMRLKQPVRAKKPAQKKGTPRFTRALGTPAMILLVLSVMGATILIASHQPAHTPDTRADAVPSAVKKPALMASAAAPLAATRPADAHAVNTSDAAPVVTASAQKPSPVTITGCLEADNETFRLKNTIGQDVPKARSWKSGFLKKGPASIEVVDASHRLKLPTHVGRRVSVSGVLVGREMQVRSLQRVAASCDQKS